MLSQLSTGVPMPRSARFYCPDGIFHIISRCHAHEYLLEGDQEHDRYLMALGRTLAHTDARLLAWCIMSNHAHLVVQAGKEPLSRLTKPLNTGYAVWKNRKENRIGSVFADRPKMVLVETEPYLLELVRYVHLNPVRAGLADHAEESTWSSHNSYVGLTTPPPWLQTELVMSYFPSGPRRGPKAFAEFVDEARDEPRRPELVGELDRGAARELRRAIGPGASYSDTILGTPEYVQQVSKIMARSQEFQANVSSSDRTPGLRELVAAACAVLEVDETNFDEHPKMMGPRQARQVVAWLWVKQFGRQQSELARYLNVGRDQVAHWYTKAIDLFEELEPIIRQVLQAMPPEVVSERQFTRNAKHAEIELLLTQATATGEALTRQTAASQSKIAQLNTESKRLFPVRAEYNKMEREIDQALRHLAFWEGNLNRVKMSLTAEDGNRGIQLNFIKPCGALSRPVSPDLTHVVMAALGMALLASAVSVLFAHRTNESFAGGEELAESVGVPLIGAVSEIISKQQRRIKRLRQCVIYPLNLAGMTAVLLVMTATLYLNLKRPETYHRILDDPGLFISEKMSADPGAGDQED